MPETSETRETASDDENENSERTAIAISVCCLMFFALPVPIISIVMAINGARDACLVTSPIGLNLSQWLMGSGIGGLISILGLVTLLILTYWCELNKLAFGTFVLIILTTLFNLVYSILGSIILFGSNQACLTQGTEIGVMSFIVLILYWLSVLSRLCSRSSSSND